MGKTIEIATCKSLKVMKTLIKWSKMHEIGSNPTLTPVGITDKTSITCLLRTSCKLCHLLGWGMILLSN